MAATGASAGDGALDHRAGEGLLADVLAALARAGEVDDLLQACAEAVVRHLDAAFARVWVLDRDGEVLELAGSAGMYTHLDDDHSRVRVGALKIGQIAGERRAHVTNDVANDPRVSDRGWARREGMVAFAGYPLVIDGRLVGVMALFARHELAEDSIEALPAVADAIAAGVERARAQERLRAEHQALSQLQRVAVALSSAQFDLREVVQVVTDAATELSGAEFGAFFYNVIGDDGESYMLYTISGVPAEAFDGFPLPRNTPVFDATFRGLGVERLEDVTEDPRYGRMGPPYHGMPEGHLPVRAYLAVPVVGRDGSVLGACSSATPPPACSGPPASWRHRHRQPRRHRHRERPPLPARARRRPHPATQPAPGPPSRPRYRGARRPVPPGHRRRRSRRRLVRRHGLERRPPRRGRR